MLKRISAASSLVLLLLASCSSSSIGQAPSPPSAATPTGSPHTPTATATAQPAASGLPNFKHIFVLVMENEESSDVIGNSEAPYINSLAHRYSRAANYFGITHPSLPNYLELLGGSTFGIDSDCETCFVHAPNLVDQLETARKSWKAYMEDMPSPCFVGDDGDYAQRHNPFIYFDNIRTNPKRCANVVPLSSFASNLRAHALPNFVWITPNLCHDMHDCGVATGDAWLKSFLPQILRSPDWQSSVLFLIWDEGSSDAGCCQIADGGHIPMLVISPLSKPGFVSHVAYNHASLLLTIEEAWGLGKLGDAACSCTHPMRDFFAGA
ncbi:MAG TPA: alkaline phosphatase family protein [Ktedonobacterales bacterium]|jgi:phospholipase C